MQTKVIFLANILPKISISCMHRPAIFLFCLALFCFGWKALDLPLNATGLSGALIFTKITSIPPPCYWRTAAFSKIEIIGGIQIFGASKFCLLGKLDAVYEPFKLYLHILSWHLLCSVVLLDAGRRLAVSKVIVFGCVWLIVKYLMDVFW